MKKKLEEIRQYTHLLAGMFGIAFLDGAFMFGIPEWVYIIFGLTQIYILYKLYKLTK